ncbi:MAG TPA: alanine racemase [Terriglobales bacterium]|nr:alanine racemase [Terriglobales bacterium]
MNMRPTWAEVSLTALQHNYSTVRDYVAPDALVCAVVKANAYGHGAPACAQALQKEGAKWFAVTSVEEGVELRKAGIRGRILLLSGFWRGQQEAVIEYNLTPAIWDWEQIQLLEDAAEKMDKAPQSVPVHLKVDTGMARLGVSVSDLPIMIQALHSANFVMLEGLFSHMASADVIDSPDVEAQILRYEGAVTQVVQSGLSPIYFHLANSAAIVSREKSWNNMVRPGISLYGYYLPFMSVVSGHPDHSRDLPVKPVLSWKTRIISLRDVGARQALGYSAAYITQSPARIAALPVGYGDGLSRHLSSRGRVIVRGDYANIVGNVSMDITLVDVTGISVEVGDEVILIGESGKRSITAWDHAGHAQTIPYEILCNISARVPRIYVE